MIVSEVSGLALFVGESSKLLAGPVGRVSRLFKEFGAELIRFAVVVSCEFGIPPMVLFIKFPGALVDGLGRFWRLLDEVELEAAGVLLIPTVFSPLARSVIDIESTRISIPASGPSMYSVMAN